MSLSKYCPLCEGEFIDCKPDRVGHHIKCNCQQLIRNDSSYKITEEAFEDIFLNGKFNQANREKNKKELMLLRYYHCRAQQRNPEGRLIETNFINRVTEETLPSVAEQLDNLILWCGKNVDHHKGIIGEFLSFGHIIGSWDESVFNAVLDGAKELGYLKNHNTLTMGFSGWLKYDELSRGSPKSWRAFMAMKFNDMDLDRVFKQCFVPAVKKTGFNLSDLRGRPQTGLIDISMIQEIRSARFIIADLTHENNGAYWEAGYAEGLGKPVIYTCEKKTFDDKNTHFDTNHHHTIMWDMENLKDAEDKLKEIIRFDIPEAKQVDEENHVF